jgi:hypothetical protein
VVHARPRADMFGKAPALQLVVEDERDPGE